MSLLPDYSRQARSYDRTRGASPEVVALLQGVLAKRPGRRLADIGGGTGNYAEALAAAGWLPLVVDRSPEMLAQAEAKGLPTLLADAGMLPLADASFDAAVLLSMLHHVEDAVAALREAGRIVVPAGTVAALVCTREDVEGLWLLDLFPASAPWMLATHPPAAELLQALPGGERHEVVLSDLVDASIAVLANHPQLVLQERFRHGTSYFERLARDHPQELQAGLRKLQLMCSAGSPPTAPGRTSLLIWTAT